VSRRKRRHEQHENHERWLVSYADFITLLFAFFVVMFASAQGTKASQVSASVRAALEEGKFTAAVSAALGRGKHEANKKAAVTDPASTHETPPPASAPQSPQSPKADLAKSLAQLQSKIAPELQNGKVQVRLDDRGLTISMREAGFFASGDAAVQPSSLAVIEKIASVVAALPNSVRLEGHTDARPIHTSRFRSNWELSTARAIAMLELLQNRYQIPSDRLAVAGYGENAPADTNDTEQGRAHNRRVDLVVLSAQGMKSEPLPAPAAAPAAATASSAPASPAPPRK
jgi:chemotaxis protein MotB